MSEHPTTRLAFAPGVRVFIPLLYAAWSDRVLTPSEVRNLQRQAASLPFLTDDDKAQLLHWSDPAHPPGRDLFKFWEITCQEAAAR
ncbi:MAG: acyl-CoA oxidase, partial [Lewinella sp.]|nr:acyl-CoA oxidase [Lewinella sp.]